MTTTTSQLATSSLEPTERVWLTLREAADVLGVHVNTLRRWADGGAIRSYRTLGGHRRLSAPDIYAMAHNGSSPAPTSDMTSLLDEHTTVAIEAALRGELGETQCCLRLRALGRRAGDAARDSGQNTSQTITSHLRVRRSINDVVANVRHAAGIGRSEFDERQWSDTFAGAYILGLVESAGAVDSRAGGGERRGDVAVHRRGPPQ